MVNMKSVINNYKSSLVDNIITNWPSELDGHLHYCIGLSGGIDSVVLLNIFHEIRRIRPINLTAIHINHNLSSNSQNWAIFCKHLCQNLDIELIIKDINVVKIGGEGLENSARKLRYQEYQKSNVDVMILAHHQDDQIETMLSQIMRGSDLHNCAGMQILSRRKQQLFWRPLLNSKKSDLIEYSQNHNLRNIEDESNSNNQYLRNFIRNKIMPDFINYDNEIINKLDKTIQNIKYYVDFADEIANADFITCKNTNEALYKDKFILLSNKRQLNVLSYLIKKSHLPIPSNKKLVEFNRQILSSALDKHPKLKINVEYSICLEKKIIFIKKV